MNKKNIIFGLLFIILISSFAIVTAEENIINNGTSVNYGSYSTYTIHYSNGSSVSGNITHNDTNNLVNNNHTVEITGEILDFELEPNEEPKPPILKGNEVTMKETGNNTLLLCITLIICAIILLIVVMKLGD